MPIHSAYPSADQLDALDLFAKANGRNWKSKLRQLWLFGRDPDLPYAHLLRQVRNEQPPAFLVRYQAGKDRNKQIAKAFGASVEVAGDGRFNFFTHPGNCAFGFPVLQSAGQFETKELAWEACGAVIEARQEQRPVTWL